MTETKINLKSVENATVQLQWQPTPTVLVDQIVGFAAVDNVLRVVLGEVIFNPGGDAPAGRPVVTLAGSAEAWVRIKDQLTDVIEQLTADGNE